MEKKKTNKHLNSFQIIIFGFLGIILLGALLLMLPISSQARAFTPFTDCLFTAVSATCVTGLVVRDTATYWSLFGKVIILLLIQIGGLGIITIMSAILISFNRRLGLKSRILIHDAFNLNEQSFGIYDRETGKIASRKVVDAIMDAVE